MSIRSRLSSIMGQIEAEYPDYLHLNLEKLLNMTVYTLSSTNIGPEPFGLFDLEFAKISEYDFVDTLASTNVDHLVPNMVRMYMTMRSWISSIMGEIRQ